VARRDGLLIERQTDNVLGNQEPQDFSLSAKSISLCCVFQNIPDPKKKAKQNRNSAGGKTDEKQDAQESKKAVAEAKLQASVRKSRESNAPAEHVLDLRWKARYYYSFSNNRKLNLNQMEPVPLKGKGAFSFDRIERIRAHLASRIRKLKKEQAKKPNSDLGKKIRLGRRTRT